MMSHLVAFGVMIPVHICKLGMDFASELLLLPRVGGTHSRHHSQSYRHRMEKWVPLSWLDNGWTTSLKNFEILGVGTTLRWVERESEIGASMDLKTVSQKKEEEKEWLSGTRNCRWDRMHHSPRCLGWDNCPRKRVRGRTEHCSRNPGGT